MFEAHGVTVAHGKSRGIQEIDFQMEEGFQQIGQRVGRITVIAVERDDDVAGCVAKASFVRAAIASNVLANHFGAERTRDVGGAVGGPVIDDDDWSTKSGRRRRTFSIPCSSFRHGMMTVIRWPLYMKESDAGVKLYSIGRRRPNQTGRASLNHIWHYVDSASGS